MAREKIQAHISWLRCTSTGRGWPKRSWGHKARERKEFVRRQRSMKILPGEAWAPRGEAHRSSSRPRCKTRVGRWFASLRVRITQPPAQRGFGSASIAKTLEPGKRLCSIIRAAQILVEPVQQPAHYVTLVARLVDVMPLTLVDHELVLHSQRLQGVPELI
jgi:hypothetical protein